MRAAIVIVLCGAVPAIGQSSETPRTGLVDKAGVVDANSERQINAVLLELEQKELAMFKVLVVDSTKGVDPYTYTIETARRWALGTRGKDNGLLLMVAVKDRRYRFAIGEGLEAAAPDAYTDTVGKQYLEPNFKRGDYGRGIHLGVAAIARRIAAEAGVEISRSAAPLVERQARRGRERGVPVGGGGGASGAACCLTPIFPLLLILVVFGSLASRRGRYYRTWGGGGLWQGMLLGTLLGQLGRGRGGWSGGSSWGGFGGGGFGGGGGGFGGGFGGSFGGGGSGGSW